LRPVLVVAYFFPPMGGGGVQRTLKFIKYLPECGWRPIVVTPRPSRTRLNDADLAAEIPTQAQIIRTGDLGLPNWMPWRLRAWITRWLFMVDDHIGWYAFAMKACQKCIREEGVQAIYSTSAPYTDHIIGYRLKQRTNLPWVADFRDPWVGNFSAAFPTRLHQRLAEKMERAVVRAADRVLVVSEPMRQAMAARHPDLPAAKVVVLPNGYDRQDFVSLQPEAIQAAEEMDRFLLVYSGSFYGRRQTAEKFLLALQQIIQAGLVPKERLRVRFVGNSGKQTLELIETTGLKEVCQTTGYLPHRQSLAHLIAADVLLLIVGRGPGSEAVFTGKIFEYLASGKTILCLADPGAAADLVREAQAGVVVDPEDIPAIADRIKELYLRWAGGGLNQQQAKPEVLKRYERGALTSQLAAVLNEITNARLTTL
jgi:glycosyltransferase involved in cell wall biosynthesis